MFLTTFIKENVIYSSLNCVETSFSYMYILMTHFHQRWFPYSLFLYHIASYIYSNAVQFFWRVRIIDFPFTFFSPHSLLTQTKAVWVRVNYIKVAPPHLREMLSDCLTASISFGMCVGGTELFSANPDSYFSGLFIIHKCGASNSTEFRVYMCRICGRRRGKWKYLKVLVPHGCVIHMYRYRCEPYWWNRLD